jgi:RNA polymerase sigma-70 factor (ECF subfamily)
VTKSLARVFCDERGGDPADGLDAQLRELVEAGRRAWPAIALAPDAFVRHLARHVPPEIDLADVRTDDLYLSAACLAGDKAAVTAFDAEFLSRIPAIVRRVAKSQSGVDELVQHVRVAILTATSGEARLAQYSGRGPLHGWVRTVALNAALMAARPKREAVHDSRDLADRGDKLGVAGGLDVELAKKRHVPQFQQALDGALATLTPRERNLLRAYYVDEMSIDRLGVRFRVHRATAARWLQAARDKLLGETRRKLGELVEVTPSEFDSLATAIKSQLSISFGVAR